MLMYPRVRPPACVVCIGTTTMTPIPLEQLTLHTEPQGQSLPCYRKRLMLIHLFLHSRGYFLFVSFIVHIIHVDILSSCLRLYVYAVCDVLGTLNFPWGSIKYLLSNDNNLHSPLHPSHVLRPVR